VTDIDIPASVNESGEAEFFENYNKLKDREAEQKEKLDDCVNRFNNVGHWESLLIPPWSWSGIADSLNEVGEGLYKLWDKVADYLSPGNPFDLWRAAEGWNGVLSEITGQKSNLETYNFPATKSWVSREANLYKSLPVQQLAAVSNMELHIGAFHDLLATHACGLVGSWITLFKKLTKFGVTMIKDAAAFVSANPLKWADLAQNIMILVADLLECVVDIAASLADYVVDVQDQVVALKQQLADKTGSDGGSWPKLKFS